ncbi:MAG: hypothetical protein LUF02_07345 [Erysipelotrichaceae bacterium]|nr:hypothetical protein [Erysipelotrichaceae bacterium]
MTAKDYYTAVRELPSGYGFADIAFIPKDDKPALLVELKWNKDVQTAIDQILDKKYPLVLEHYKDNLLLVLVMKKIANLKTIKNIRVRL